MEFVVTDDEGLPLDATVEVESGTIILHSRGGAAGSPNARNRDYSTALRLILRRLLDQSIEIEGAWVDSSRVQQMPLGERQILSRDDPPETSEQLFTRMSRRMQAVGRSPDVGPGRGNSNKRIRIEIGARSTGDIAHAIGAIPKDRSVPRHAVRLSAEQLRKVTPEHVWQAISNILLEGPGENYGPSTDYDLLTDAGLALPPKAVFGQAASLALGRTVGPTHFSTGLGTPCFDILQKAGYRIVPKGEAVDPAEELSAGDKVWTEGNVRLLTHLRRERGHGLSRAKKAEFIRKHGRLFCERCKMDPVVVFADKDGEACIEVHHHKTAVAEMGTRHETRLDDLQCLCANCHRYVHRIMKSMAADN